MKFSSIVLGLASALTATAKISYQVTGFGSGCSPGGCGAGFNVSAPADYLSGAPAFKFNCAIILGRPYADCTALDGSSPSTSKVSAQWRGLSYPYPYGENALWVSHVFRGTDAVFNATGYYEYNFQTESPKDFPMQVISVTTA